MSLAPAFTRDDDVLVHKQGAIRQICAHFRSHEDGLPEWAKNSADAYTRMGRSREDSVVVILLRDERTAKSGLTIPTMVGCLDFGGMTVSVIEDKFRHWADPDAAGEAEGVLGGHGNGGKCYMTQLFQTQAYLHTCMEGRGNRYGFVGGDPTPGYFPSPAEARDYTAVDPNKELQRALEPFGLQINQLPELAQRAWAKSQSFTLVAGVGAKNLKKGRIPAGTWAENLAGHQQMVGVLARCQVFVLHNNKAVADASPLSLPVFDPIPGAEAGRIILVPAELEDPYSGVTVETGATPDSRLELRTSKKTMRSPKRQARHTIAGWTVGGRSTGNWEVTALSSAAYANNIYGDIYLDGLQEFTQNDRRHHSEAPYTRAVRRWIVAQIEAYSDEFSELDRLHSTQEQKNELSRLNQALNDWKDRFLREEFGDGQGGSDDGRTGGRDPKPLPRDQVSQVILKLGHQASGVGVSFRPQVDFLNSKGERVRAVPHEWRSTNEHCVSYDVAINMFVANAVGKSQISLICKDSGVASQEIDFEVLDIERIDLEPLELAVAQGSRSSIVPTIRTTDGRVLDAAYLTWTEDNPGVASVGSSGVVYGVGIGTTSAICGDDATLASEPVIITVTQAKDDGDRGGGFPTILLSEIDVDPLGEIPPIFSPSDPPVYQRPQDVDANIWWINMASPLARRYIDTAKGGGTHSREWRVYHLERYIEVMIKIVLTYSFRNGDNLTFETILARWEQEATLMQQRAADTLAEFLEGGDVVLADAA